MGKADDRRDSPVEFHLFQIDRDLEDGDAKFAELRQHFDDEIRELKAQLKTLARIGTGILVSLTITAISLLLNLAKP